MQDAFVALRAEGTEIATEHAALTTAAATDWRRMAGNDATRTFLVERRAALADGDG